MRIFIEQQLTEVCHDVKIEPQLKPLPEEVFCHQSGNTTDDAGVGTSKRSFWVRSQLAFSYIRVFNPLASYYILQNLKPMQVSYEKVKNRSYSQRY